MAIKLQVAIRKIASNKYQLQIREQFSRHIDYQNSLLNLICRSRPEICSISETFYLRGASDSRDNDWIFLPTGMISPLITTLNSYAEYTNFLILEELASDNTEIVISLCDKYVFSQESFFNEANVVANILNLNINEMREINSNPIKILCKNCGTELEKKETPAPFSPKLCKSCLDTMINCDSCGRLSDSKKINKHTTSLGEKIKVCKFCLGNICPCQNCGFNEIVNFIKPVSSIDDEGRTLNQNFCMKCSKDTVKCRNCSYQYFKDYPKCPCRIPTNFQNWILPFNADVVNELGRELDCEIGLEIEVGVPRKNRISYEEVFRHTRKLIKDKAIMVFDRSIDEVDTTNHILNDYSGFEIVTKPMNRHSMIEFINNFSKNRHKLLRSYDVKTAGLHIHVARFKNYLDEKTGTMCSKPFISKIEIGKLLLFINNEENRELLHHISRRINPRYAGFRPKRIVDYGDNSRECHYDALNTNKPHTIEFRIFRGSLKRETILEYIEFVYSAIEFVRNTSKENLISNKYIEWLGKTNRSRYRHLKKRLRTFGDPKELEVGGDS